MTFWIFLFILGFFLQNSCAKEPVIVHTQYGDILGYQTDIARVFYGIPFAQPPIGPLRWQPPVPVVKWSPQTINATQPPPACSQPPNSIWSIRTSSGVRDFSQISEDCLYLNIFTPLLNNSSSTSSLPVMLFIHGGGFRAGSASDPSYESEHLVNTTNVIVVLLQYRLGVLGFLATGNGRDDIKGNYGILDQRLAIAWVKANIEVFGGDPNQITLFGQSAGAQSTALHFITQDMQSFFQQAIIESAPFTVPFRTYSEYIAPAVLLAEQLQCSINNVTCFRLRSTEEIITAQSAVDSKFTSLNPLLFFEPWLPVIDNDIIHGSILNISDTSFSWKSLVIGTVTDECLDFVYSRWQKVLTPSEYIVLMVGLYGEKAGKVLEKYPPEGEGDQRDLVVRGCTQWVFVCPTRAFARKGALYYYAYGYPSNGERFSNRITCRGHACHGDELPIVFEANWGNLTDADRRMSQHVATYWTNFAKSQNPNEPFNVSLSWPKMNSTNNEPYMFLQDPLQIEENYLKSDCDFWDQIGYKMLF